MKISIYTIGIVGALSLTASVSEATPATVSLSETGARTVSVTGMATITAGTAAGVKDTDVQLYYKLPSSHQLGRTIFRAHNAIEAQWLMRYLQRTTAKITLTYDSAPHDKLELTDLARFTISVDGKEAVDLDEFADAIRFALEQNENYYTPDLEGRWDWAKREKEKAKAHFLKRPLKVAPYPDGYPKEGVRK